MIPEQVHPEAGTAFGFLGQDAVCRKVLVDIDLQLDVAQHRPVTGRADADEQGLRAAHVQVGHRQPLGAAASRRLEDRLPVMANGAVVVVKDDPLAQFHHTEDLSVVLVAAAGNTGVAALARSPAELSSDSPCRQVDLDLVGRRDQLASVQPKAVGGGQVKASITGSRGTLPSAGLIGRTRSQPSKPWSVK